MPTEVLVFVPGTLGSDLWDGDDRIWPGSIAEALKGFGDERFQQLLKPGLTSKDIVRSVAGGLVGIYRPWIQAFEAIRRGETQLFRENPPAGSPKTLHVFPYDWRADLRDTAGQLATFLDRLLTAIPNADLKLVCHSMGGVVTRFFLESGKFATHPAISRVSLFATFGTPHNGAPVAYAGAVGLDKADFLSVSQTMLLANDPRYPSLYQLFPIAGHSFIWDSRTSAPLKNLAADDAQIVNQFGLNAQSLTAWRQLRQGLTGNRPNGTRYFYVIGSRQQTLTRFSWDGVGLEKIELDDAGDGTVPLLGAMDTSTQSAFVGKSHVSLIDTAPARQTLAALFGAPSVLAAGAVQTTIVPRKPVVATDEEVHVQIEFAPGTDDFKGVVKLQRAVIPDPLSNPTMVSSFTDLSSLRPIPVELHSAGLEYVNLKIAPIELPGIYRAVLSADNQPDAMSPEFVVQKIQSGGH